MSSIVRKSTHFAPKIKKKPIKRKVGKASSPLTPPATQVGKVGAIDDSSREGDKDNDESQPGADITTPGSTQKQPESSQIIPINTPESSQIPKDNNKLTSVSASDSRPSFSFTITESPKKTSPLKDAEEEDVDPKDTSRKVGTIPHSVDEISTQPIEDSDKENSEVSDDEVFTLPVESTISRRQSSVAQRRLSGITPTTIRSRSGSISFKPSQVSELDSQKTPGRIGIPEATVPVKRRRSSVQKPSDKRMSIRASIAISKSQALSAREPSPVPEVETEVEKENSKDGEEEETKSKPNNNEFVVGVDPQTNRLRKFRLRAHDVGVQDTIVKKIEEPSSSLSIESGSKTTKEHEVIPVAPKILSSTIADMSQLPKMVKDEDVDLFADVEFDVSKITMADLCKPSLPVGKVSSNFEKVRAAEELIKSRREQRSQDRQTAREEKVSLDVVEARREKENPTETGKKVQNLLEGDDEPVSSLGLQLNLTSEGVIQLDTDSTVVSRHLRTDNSGMVREEDNPFMHPITSSTYSKRRHTDRWTADELRQFYQALSTFGTDFSLIAQLFPYRTRKQIKMKFNLEEKKFPEIVEMALRRKLPADFDQYCEDTKQTIESLEYYNEKLKQVRVEHEDHMAVIAEERERALKEDAEASRRREIEIRTGSKPMTRAEKVKELRKNEMVVGSIEDVKKQRLENEVV
ncbi:uncharacterized protein RJT20DRAFT_124019 [Scheffersomyces xylosifermentans]|uniref:uncharacterized protein n=1 Tax=Scheffersomyces xylosifermentans TaxID=1304137 RepID=UPI00315CD375